MSQNELPNIIPKVHLQGHQGPVLCLDHSSSLRNEVSTTTAANGGSLLSGSEDGTARLWDLRAGQQQQLRAAMCLVVGKEVLSVAFAPPFQLMAHPYDDNNPFARDYCVYLSCDNHVYAYDLRQVQSPIVKRDQDPSHNNLDLSNVLGCTEEVNQLSLSPLRKPPMLLAAGDDSGTVRVIDTTTLTTTTSLAETTTGAAPQQQQHRPLTSSTRSPCPLGTAVALHHDSSGTAIVTSTSFRPRSKGWELASGGTDCCVHIWDVTKPKRPTCSYHIAPDPNHSDATTTTTASANQICNPPMVHTLSWSPSGRLLAVGLGDGTCRVLRVEGRSSCVEVARLDNNNSTAPVASVLFPEWSASSSMGTTTKSSPACSRHVAAQDRLLTSAANDGVVLGWDLGSVVAGDGAHDPALFLHDRVLQTANNNNNMQTQQPMMTVDSLSDAMEGLTTSNNTSTMEEDDNLYRPPYVVFRIPHGRKPNWMTSSRGNDSAFPSTLFVADTTNDITAYTIPLR